MTGSKRPDRRRYIVVDETFGHRLARLRKAKGLSQSEFGSLIGASQRMVSNYESRNGKPRADLIQKMADVFDMEVEELLLSESERKKAEARKSLILRKLRDGEELTTHDRKTVSRIIESALMVY